ncbi:hypothetical protein [Falsigemmobacter faecalis]|uniref:Uncharacterized protein n=1 Tax=Falsigemmobacter faecalis TaxID=2488730 RepID=A0A3P3DRM5_9RHOB|nr:hypothetical protein [Falsigemmobacter faecalis]RRH76192.1 hypothetical protein EG244_07180 [Falsigemmobacter faecalis]
MLLSVDTPKGLHNLEDIAKGPARRLGTPTGAQGLTEPAWTAGGQKEQATALLAGAQDPAVERATPHISPLSASGVTPLSGTPPQICAGWCRKSA